MFSVAQHNGNNYCCHYQCNQQDKYCSYNATHHSSCYPSTCTAPQRQYICTSSTTVNICCHTASVDCGRHQASYWDPAGGVVLQVPVRYVVTLTVFYIVSDVAADVAAAADVERCGSEGLGRRRPRQVKGGGR